MNIFLFWFENTTVLPHSIASPCPSPKLVSDVPILYTDVRGMGLQIDGQTNKCTNDQQEAKRTTHRAPEYNVPPF